MTWADFRKIILTLNIPYAYGTFKEKQIPPYLSSGVEDEPDMMADNIHYLPMTEGFLELYTGTLGVPFRDFALETKIKNLLTEHKIPWRFDNADEISTEGVHMTRWAISFIGG